MDLSLVVLHMTREAKCLMNLGFQGKRLNFLIGFFAAKLLGFLSEKDAVQNTINTVLEKKRMCPQKIHKMIHGSRVRVV